jgi:tetratricopeptide (TPR) repeat protein
MLGAMLLAGILHGFVGCAKDDVEEARKKMQQGQQEQPGVNPHEASPHGGMAMPGVGSSGPTDGAEVPLKTTGLSSAAELQRELAKLQDPRAAAHFEQAFRLTFTSDPAKRDYHEAERLLASVIETHPNFAPAYRTLGYAKFNMNPMEPSASIEDYEKAVELDPDYGEAHYAIAFMCAATGEREKGVDHYRKSIALGVEDERGIGERFYGDLLEKQ